VPRFTFVGSGSLTGNGTPGGTIEGSVMLLPQGQPNISVSQVRFVNKTSVPFEGNTPLPPGTSSNAAYTALAFLQSFYIQLPLGSIQLQTLNIGCASTGGSPLL
jgi:hypothetical protein